MIDSIEPPVPKKDVDPDATAYGMTLGEAKTATKNGAIAAFVVTAITAGLVVFAMATDAQGSIAYWNDPWAFVDAVLVAVLGIGVLRRSRTAAAALTVYFAIARMLTMAETGQVSGVLVSLLILYYFAKAVQGSFAFHRLHKQAGLNYRTRSMLAWIIGVPVGGVFLLGSIMVLLAEFGITPALDVVDGADMPPAHVAQLIEMGAIEADENIVMFYSEGMLSIAEIGQILTEERVISYETFDGELLLRAAAFDEIRQVTVYQKGDVLNYTTLEVGLIDEGYFFLSLPHEDGDDRRFLEALNTRLEEGQRLDPSLLK